MEYFKLMKTKQFWKTFIVIALLYTGILFNVGSCVPDSTAQIAHKDKKNTVIYIKMKIEYIDDRKASYECKSFYEYDSYIALNSPKDNPEIKRIILPLNNIKEVKIYK